MLIISELESYKFLVFPLLSSNSFNSFYIKPFNKKEPSRKFSNPFKSVLTGPYYGSLSFLIIWFLFFKSTLEFNPNFRDLIFVPCISSIDDENLLAIFRVYLSFPAGDIYYFYNSSPLITKILFLSVINLLWSWIVVLELKLFESFSDELRVAALRT